MAHKFKPGDLVNFKGFASGDGKGGRFIVIKQLPEINYKLQFLYTPGPIWDKWNEGASRNQLTEEYEDYLVIDVAYHRQKQLEKLGI